MAGLRKENVGRAVRQSVDEIVTSLSPFAWFRADSVISSSGSVTSILNKVGLDRLNAVAGNAVLSSSDAAMNNKPTLNFEGTQWFSSSLSPTSWKFLHDGSGSEIIALFIPTTLAGIHAIYSNITSSGTGPGQQFYTNGSSIVSQINNDAAAIFGPTVTGLTQTPSYYVTSYLENATPEIVLYQNNSAVRTANSSNVPSQNVSLSTLFLGAQPPAGSFPAVMRWADLIVFKRVLTEFERQEIREYLLSRYKINVPVVSQQDKQILALNPFSWLRSDYVAIANGKTTSYLDKTRPGHALSQGSIGSQTPAPINTASFNGQLITSYATHNYTSNFAASAWNFLHDGTGCDFFISFSPEAFSSSQILFATRTTQAGVAFSRNPATSYNHYVINAAGQVSVLTTALALPMSISTYVNFSLTGSNWSLYNKDALFATGSIANPLSTGSSENTLCLGSNPATGQRFVGNFSELLIFNRALNASERLIVQSYMTQRYWPSMDNLVQDLKPLAWFRPDNISGSISAVTRINNKVSGYSNGLVVTGTLQVSSSAINGWPTFNFEGTQHADSSEAASYWTFLHDGTGCDVFVVGASREIISGSTNVVLSNIRLQDKTTTRGFSWSLAAAASSGSFDDVAVIGNGTVSLPLDLSASDSRNTSLPIAKFARHEFFYRENNTPEWSLSVDDALNNSGSTTNVPSSTAASYTLRLGANPSTSDFKLKMNLADVLIFNRILTKEERSTVRSYVWRRYMI